MRLESEEFNNGASRSALHDGGVYYIVGTLTGEFSDTLIVEEVAKRNE